MSSRARNLRLLLCALVVACATHAPVTARARPRVIDRVDPVLTSARVYERMGLIANAGAFPITGRITFIAAATPDSTFILLALSFPFRAQTSYNVAIDVTHQGQVVRHVDTTATTHIDPTTDRQDSGFVTFQSALVLAPGDYQLALVMHDVPSDRTASRALALRVPALRTLSSAIAVHDAWDRTRRDTIPRLAQWPRATAIVGRDSTIAIYVEGYGSDARCPLRLQARAMDGSILWRDSVTLLRTGALCAGIALVPIARLGPGATMLEVWNPAKDTSTVPLFVTLGRDVPVAPFDRQLDYLRYFTTPATLAALRATPPSVRGAAWTAFLRRVGTDSLASYLRVLHQADVRFPDEGIPGWETPRGGVYLTLGDPEQIFLQSASHRQIWDYQRYLTRLVFVDDSGTGHWRLTPRSTNDYDALRKRVHR